MTEYTWLILYCLAILGFSLFGGCLPFLGQVTHKRLQLYLSASAGVMLGASFFHVMPDAMDILKDEGAAFGWWMSLGVVGLFCIERFIAPHSHEMDGGGHHAHHHNHEHGPDCEHGHEHAPASPKDHRAAAPAVAGWMAVLGLTIHTFMNGVGLASAVYTAFHPPKGPIEVALLFPGWALFLAIFLHKPADALAISMVLSRKGTSRNKLFLIQIGFALMVAAGVLAFYLTEKGIEEHLKKQLAGAALAFSAGTFLFIALSDLLPEVQFHKHDRVPLFLALILGVVLMGAISYLEDHDDDKDKEDKEDKKGNKEAKRSSKPGPHAQAILHV